MSTQITRQAPKMPSLPPPYVVARSLLAAEEIAKIAGIEAETGTKQMLAFRKGDVSFEAHLDAQVPSGAVAQRTSTGLITRQVIVGG